mmetsp:Transcript_5874/g.13114  ORF Transcript_5874/g.13114 Transcript_5874/m.13114 type:complete len:144 (-) Transcript_5874:100-531(-)
MAASRNSLLPAVLAAVLLGLTLNYFGAGFVGLRAPAGTPSLRHSVGLQAKVGDFEIAEVSEEDSEAQSIGGAVVAFVAGLLFPIVGSFTLGLLFAAFAYFVTKMVPKTAIEGDEIADLAPKVKGVGKYAVKAYNAVVGAVDKK